MTPAGRVHFVGIGGVSMSALAELLHSRGCRVTGSDRQASELTDRLAGLGIRVYIGHSAAAVGDADRVVYTAAIAQDNPELAEARRRNIPLIRRAELLGSLTRDTRLIAVTGTHGKTTTTAMVGAVLEAAGLDPTVLVGGILRGPERNLRVGRGPCWAVEADEFDRAFLALAPEVAVITSLEADHLDSYGTLDAVKAAFGQFLSSVPETGACILCADAPAVVALPGRAAATRILYGLGSGADLRADRIVLEGTTGRFRVLNRNAPLGDITLQVPGRHNIANALAAVGVGLALNLPFDPIRAGLEAFGGVHRRFEILGRASGATFVSDYAHHPTEIEATLEAARYLNPSRLVAVFQPHLYTRTRDFAPEFGAALSRADRVWLTDVYPAREPPIPGVDANLIGRHVSGPQTDTLPRLADLPGAIRADLQPGDLILFLGAGDIDALAREFYRSFFTHTG